MIIYNYHPSTREYVSRGVADPSPMEPGSYLIPSNATPLEPPAAAADEVAVFNGGRWALQADYRGKVYYQKEDGKQRTISRIGELPDDTLTDKAPGSNQKWGGSSWVLDEERILQEIRGVRDLLLLDADKMVQRHTEQLTLVSQGLLDETCITEDEYHEVLKYKQELRDLPETTNVLAPEYPEKPAVLIEKEPV